MKSLSPLQPLFIIFILINLSTEEALSQKKWAFPREGYSYQFPRDHGSHPDYKIEWWYITGHMESAEDQFGFESTFFRIGQEKTNDIHLAHMAITDVKNQAFYHEERLNKEGWNAFSESGDLDLKNGNWTLKRSVNNEFMLNFSVKADYLIKLKLTPKKQQVIFGENGISKKGHAETAASHYITFSRLDVSGTITSSKKDIPVSGSAWMDHEISSSQLDENQVGWDWVSVQLDDNREIMAYILRNKDGSISNFSKLVWVGENGELTHQGPEAFKWIQNGKYKSKETGAVYPINPSFITTDPKNKNKRKFTIIPLMDEQEIPGKIGGVPYWEGACKVANEKGKIIGKAYLELSGYSGDLKKRLN